MMLRVEKMSLFKEYAPRMLAMVLRLEDTDRDKKYGDKDREVLGGCYYGYVV